MYKSIDLISVRPRINYPPEFSHTHKALLYDIASKGRLKEGNGNEITVARVKPGTIKENRLQWGMLFKHLPAYFDYQTVEVSDKKLTEWYINFADGDLFAYYGTGLFAQDEMQVAEHPVLASIHTWMTYEPLPKPIPGLNRAVLCKTGNTVTKL